MTTSAKKPRELTGRAVLFWLVGFFVLVFGVNGVLVKAATSTFAGLETSSSYKAGLKFKDDMASAARQADLHWKVDGKLTRDKAGDAVIDVTVHDGSGAPVTGLSGTARLAHPATSRLDRDVVLEAAASGALHGVTAAQPGQWELILDLDRGGERVFRSRSRVTLK
ncbi:MAG: FixH family protein [Hyphomicrobiales bacterium]